MAQVDYKREMDDLVNIIVSETGSDIHLSVGSHPVVRVGGALVPLIKKPVLTAEDVYGFCDVLMESSRRQKFNKTSEVDFSYAAADGVRFRGNAYHQQGQPSIALRHIPNEIRNLEQLGLPPILKSFTERPQGFFLCVGPVGQGKSTTLAAMIQIINQSRSDHIVTIEDPIEYVYTPDQALIEQREVGTDTADFATGLNAIFRHLVFSTLHTNNAAQTIDRIIDSFPAGQQDQIRVQLAGSLMGIFSQRLVPKVSGGMIPTYELLINNSAVSNLIRERRTHEIQTVVETGLEHGMIDMNRSLVDLVRRGEVTVENAFAYSVNPKGLERLM